MDNTFSAIVWSEDKLPPEAQTYRNCELAQKNSRIIWGEGNPKAPIVIILDNPGAREDKTGQEFICNTRKTLQEGLFLANLNLQDIYLTYLLKIRPLGKYNKEMARTFSLPYLTRQIEQINPKYLLCLGDVVIKTLLQNEEESVRNLRGKWHLLMGRPTCISYHPLAIRRRSNLLPLFLADLHLLSQEFHPL